MPLETSRANLGKLPKAGKELWMKVYMALEDRGEDPARSARIAWYQVKQKYEQDPKTKKWKKKKAKKKTSKRKTKIKNPQHLYTPTLEPMTLYRTQDEFSNGHRRQLRQYLIEFEYGNIDLGTTVSLIESLYGH